MKITQHQGIKKLHLQYSNTFWLQFEKLCKEISKDKASFFFFIYEGETLHNLMSDSRFNKKINKITGNKDYIFSLHNKGSSKLVEKEVLDSDDDNVLYKDLIHIAGKEEDVNNLLSNIYSKFNLNVEFSLPLLIQFKISQGKVTGFYNLNFENIDDQLVIQELLDFFKEKNQESKVDVMTCSYELLKFLNNIMDVLRELGYI